MLGVVVVEKLNVRIIYNVDTMARHSVIGAGEESKQIVEYITIRAIQLFFFRFMWMSSI